MNIQRNQRSKLLVIVVAFVLFAAALLGIVVISVVPTYARFEWTGEADRIRAMVGERVSVDTSKIRYGQTYQPGPVVGRLESVEYEFNDNPGYIAMRIWIDDIWTIVKAGDQVVEGNSRTSLLLTADDLIYINHAAE